jgi:hypothetical protein
VTLSRQVPVPQGLVNSFLKINNLLVESSGRNARTREGIVEKKETAPAFQVALDSLKLL